MALGKVEEQLSDNLSGETILLKFPLYLCMEKT